MSFIHHYFEQYKYYPEELVCPLKKKKPQDFMSLFIIGRITTCLFTSYSKWKQNYVPQSKLFSYKILLAILGYLKHFFCKYKQYLHFCSLLCTPFPPQFRNDILVMFIHGIQAGFFSVYEINEVCFSRAVSKRLR